MIRNVTLRHRTDGRIVVLQTAMGKEFLERMYPSWEVFSIN
jgi:hypothetical protein